MRLLRAGQRSVRRLNCGVRRYTGGIMSSNRHVPAITGIVALALAAWFLFGFSGWWRYIPSTLLLAFGWVSIKTALFASSKELRELTTSEPMSEETRRKLEDRL